MKQLILGLLVTSAFFIISCGNTSNQEQQQDEDEESTEEMYDEMYDDEDDNDEDTIEYESILDTLYVHI